LIKLDGYDDAILGPASVWQDGEQVETLVYSAAAICAILVKRDGMSEEEAREFVEHNIECMYIGEATPILVWPEDRYYDFND